MDFPITAKVIYNWGMTVFAWSASQSIAYAWAFFKNKKLI